MRTTETAEGYTVIREVQQLVNVEFLAIQLPMVLTASPAWSESNGIVTAQFSFQDGYTKSGTEFVTVMDRRSEELLIEGLAREFPGDAVLAELDALA